MSLEKYLDVPVIEDITLLGDKDPIIKHCLNLMAKGALKTETCLMIMVVELQKENEALKAQIG